MRKVLWKCVDDGKGAKGLYECACGTRLKIQRTHIGKTAFNCKKCSDKESRRIACGNQFRTHGMSKTRIYKSWGQMLVRCRDPKNPQYKHYGGRGITVCDDWHDFQKFYRDMGPMPDGMELERIDNNLGYSKENCRWATHKEQCRNRRSSKWVEYNGRRMTVAQLAEEHPRVRYECIQARLNRGMTAYEAVHTPVKRYSSAIKETDSL